ncbi:MAG: alanine--glyoxylate aminotransferase family protein [Candidatus Methanomethylophilaceae archaeon]|nr:alanine--glyoxylate aminotransferase family protein [Candidatus Methanomethylophilaceae archaeon]MBR1452244.1 alanine--glyoxylate aminotransferase family protein [Candidatus Methanomethylophilaceae archaeon]
MSRTLFTVGPVYVEDATLQAMTKPMITHRCKEYKELHAGIVEKIQKALGTDMDVFLVGGSATVMLEAAIRNGVNSNSLGITNGSFGNRSIELGELNGKNVTKVEVPWGKAMKPEHIAGKVTKDIEAVHWVSNESSTGVFSDSLALTKEIRAQNPDALTMIDAVTSAFAMDLKVKDLDADSIVFGTQKALALPPGLAIMLCSERLLDKAKTVPNRGFYGDLLKIKKQADVDYALTTPPVSLMYALDSQLDKALKEGMSARYARHKEMADMVRNWADKKLHGVFPEAGYQSNSIGVLNKGDMDFDAFNSKLKAKGYEISNGYGDIKEATFRIGHMGDTTPAMVKELLSAMDEVLEE